MYPQTNNLKTNYTMRFNKKILIVMLLLFGKIVGAQTMKVEGVVTDKTTGERLTGVSVFVKNSSNGAITGDKGEFFIEKLTGKETLVFSFIGYKTLEEEINSRTKINITLSPDVESIKEVVVVGYGTLDKREVTSSITSIKGDDFLPSLQSNPLMSVQGKVTGLNIISENGSDPNSKVSLQLRGSNSVLAGQGPLVVIDGIPGADLQSVAPTDIKSIDVLKDASAAAIYGTRASGGVILVTTKQAGNETVSVNYLGEMITETIKRYAEPLGPDEFMKVGLEKKWTDYGYRTDWFDVITRTPFSHKHTVSVSGGSKTTKVYSSFYYRDLEGVAIGSSRKELGGRINLNYSTLDGLLDIITHSSYSQQTGNYVSNDIFRQAVILNPTQTPYDSKDVTGLNVWTGAWEYYNPLAEVKLKTDRRQYNYLLSDVTAKLNLTKDFNVSGMLGIKKTSEHDVEWFSREHRIARENKYNGEARQEQKVWDEFTFEGLANYSKRVNKHSIKLLAGTSYQKFDGEGFSAKNRDFPVDGVKWYDMGSGTYLSDGRAEIGSWRNPTEKIAAFFGRVNYSFADKYMLMASLRYEGSSKFSPDNRWGMFPAISAGWRLSDEMFIREISMINDLKIRAGYGKTGNQDFGSGRYTRQYGADTWWLNGGSWIKTYGLSFNTNPNLSWETKTEYNVGVDFAFFNNKLSGKLDVYKRISDNLIYDISVSQPPAVHDKTTMNSGSLTNTGWEAEVTYTFNKKDFNASSTLRASSNRNKLKSLWGSQTFWDRKGFPSPGSPGDAVRLAPGEYIGQFFLWKHAGFTDNGKWLFYDKNNEIITSNKKNNGDKRLIGNAIPRLILSWDNTFTWKSFDLSIFMRSWINYDVFNMIEFYHGLINTGRSENVVKEYYERDKHITEEKALTDYFLHDGTFLKIDVITLGYRFNVQKLKYIKNFRVFATGRNLFTFTSYNGLDPEVNINGLDPGFEERDVYPKTRIFTFGVQLSF